MIDSFFFGGMCICKCVFVRVLQARVSVCVCTRSCVGRCMYVSQKRTLCAVPQILSVWFCCFSEAGSLARLVLIK